MIWRQLNVSIFLLMNKYKNICSEFREIDLYSMDIQNIHRVFFMHKNKENLNESP